MKTICFAAVAATMLAGCATATTDNGSASGMSATRAAAGKQYCLENRLASTGGKLSCNWATNKASACEGDAPFVAMDADRYTTPRASSQCSNGRTVVEVAPLA